MCESKCHPELYYHAEATFMYDGTEQITFMEVQTEIRIGLAKSREQELGRNRRGFLEKKKKNLMSLFKKKNKNGSACKCQIANTK